MSELHYTAFFSQHIIIIHLHKRRKDPDRGRIGGHKKDAQNILFYFTGVTGYFTNFISFHTSCQNYDWFWLRFWFGFGLVVWFHGGGDKLRNVVGFDPRG